MPKNYELIVTLHGDNSFSMATTAGCPPGQTPEDPLGRGVEGCWEIYVPDTTATPPPTKPNKTGTTVVTKKPVEKTTPKDSKSSSTTTKTTIDSPTSQKPNITETTTNPAPAETTIAPVTNTEPTTSTTTETTVAPDTSNLPNGSESGGQFASSTTTTEAIAEVAVPIESDNNFLPEVLGGGAVLLFAGSALWARFGRMRK